MIFNNNLVFSKSFLKKRFVKRESFFGIYTIGLAGVRIGVVKKNLIKIPQRNMYKRSNQKVIEDSLTKIQKREFAVDYYKKMKFTVIPKASEKAFLESKTQEFANEFRQNGFVTISEKKGLHYYIGEDKNPTLLAQRGYHINKVTKFCKNCITFNKKCNGTHIIPEQEEQEQEENSVILCDNLSKKIIVTEFLTTTDSKLLSMEERKNTTTIKITQNEDVFHENVKSPPVCFIRKFKKPIDITGSKEDDLLKQDLTTRSNELAKKLFDSCKSKDKSIDNSSNNNGND